MTRTMVWAIRAKDGSLYYGHEAGWSGNRAVNVEAMHRTNAELAPGAEYVRVACYHGKAA